MNPQTLSTTPKYVLQNSLAELLNISRTDPTIISLSREELISRLFSEEAKKTSGVVMVEGKEFPPSPQTTLDLQKLLDTEISKLKAEILSSLKAVTRPPEKTIVITRSADGETKTELSAQHNQFETLLQLCTAKVHVFLVGPAGSGKTTAASNVAKALNLPFYFNGAIENEYKLTGFIDAHGKVVSKPFREAFLNGGVYLFDEVDASLPSAVLAFNAALANAKADFPDGCYEAHPDFTCIAAGNTFYGADHQYVGRMKQDAAFLDRFVVLDWHYDTNLELSIARGAHSDQDLVTDWTNMIWKVREEAARIGLQIVVSPRATTHGLRCMKAGLTWEKSVEVTLRKTMKHADWAKISPFTHRPLKEKEVVVINTTAKPEVFNEALRGFKVSDALELLDRGLALRNYELTPRARDLVRQIANDVADNTDSKIRRIKGVYSSPKCIRSTASINMNDLKKGLI